MKYAIGLTCFLVIGACGDDGSSATTGPASTGALGTSTTESPSGSTTEVAADSTTTVTPTTAGPECAGGYEPCSPLGCCDGYVCVTDASKTDVCCQEGDNGCYCVCSSLIELEPVPEACADIGLEPSMDAVNLAAWLDGATTIRASSHAEYYCTDTDFAAPVAECPCVSTLDLYMLDFESLRLVEGEATATVSLANAACRDVCEVTGEPDALSNVTVQILAVSESCVVAEADLGGFPLRVFVDRMACA